MAQRLESKILNNENRLNWTWKDWSSTLGVTWFHRLEVVCVSDIDETLCQQTVNKFNIPTYTLTYEELVSDHEVQAVWVCSPSIYITLM